MFRAAGSLPALREMAPLPPDLGCTAPMAEMATSRRNLLPHKSQPHFVGPRLAMIVNICQTSPRGNVLAQHNSVPGPNGGDVCGRLH